MFWSTILDLLPEYWTSPPPPPPQPILSRLKAELAALSSSDDGDTDEPEAEDWTAEEDFALRKWALVYERDWKRVAARVLGRSAEACCRRWVRGNGGRVHRETWEALRRDIETVAELNQDLSLRKATVCFRALRSNQSSPPAS